MPENQNINLDTSFNLSIPKLNPADQINNVSNQDNNISSSATGSNENKLFERALLSFPPNYDVSFNETITQVGEIESVSFEKDLLFIFESNSLSPDMSSDELTCKICTKFKFDQNNVGKLKISLGDQELKEFDFSNYQKNQNNICLCNFSNFPKDNLLNNAFNLNFSTTTNEHPICRNIHIDISIEIENKDFKASSNSITLNFIQEQMLNYKTYVQYSYQYAYWGNGGDGGLFNHVGTTAIHSLIQSGSIRENSANVYSNDSPAALNLADIVNTPPYNYSYTYAFKQLYNGDTYIKDIDSYGTSIEPSEAYYKWAIIRYVYSIDSSFIDGFGGLTEGDNNYFQMQDLYINTYINPGNSRITLRFYKMYNGEITYSDILKSEYPNYPNLILSPGLFRVNGWTL